MTAKKKLLGLLLFGVVMNLAACSSDESNTDENTIRVWTMSDGLDEFVTEYEEETGINVEVQTIPWDNAHDKLVTAVASGEGPDVLQIGSTWIEEFAEAGTFMDLTDYIDNYENLSPKNFYESSVAFTDFEGETVGIPWYVDTRVLFYRTDILADVGYPEGPATWEEMIDASEQLAARGDDQYAIDLEFDDIHFPYIFAWQHGWEYEMDKEADNFEKSSFRDAIALYQLFYDNGYSQLGEGKEFFQSFSDGSKPMFFSGPWDVHTIQDRVPEIEGDWSTRVMPSAENNDSMMGGAHLTVFHNSQKREQALDFINWMADSETQVKWYEFIGELPANLEAWDDPILADDEMMSTFGEQLEATPSSPVVPHYERIGGELLDSLEKIIRGGEDIDESLEEFISQADSILNR
ncbi:extracellular solute-binding protein [Oceanobacillus timonensis]|uniref:extracellular solute-binding protein n=1 Tax=Oceanobacillus timonensis TaxID=1926285 RepID=UPI001FE8F8ED|nr:extracellular solute-binding protein [Oceanobacillus timonensis]